jgi:hypothetical protein
LLERVDGDAEDVHVLLAVQVERQLPLLPVVADYSFEDVDELGCSAR